MVADFVRFSTAPRFSELVRAAAGDRPVWAIDPVTDLAQQSGYVPLDDLAAGYADALAREDLGGGVAGRLEFLGRTDGQIKLRGHRIELAELESAAADHPAVREAVAVLPEAGDPQKAHIALFAVAGPDEVTPREIRRWMAQRLPPAMVPGRISVEAKLPRTTSGKVDRVALAASPPP